MYVPTDCFLLFIMSFDYIPRNDITWLILSYYPIKNAVTLTVSQIYPRVIRKPHTMKKKPSPKYNKHNPLHL